jgi:hypothetical protein
MKKMITCAVVLFAGALPVISAIAQDVKVDPALMGRYALMDKGMENGDVPAYLSVAAPALVTI